jgi:hypothetical protein
MYLFTLQQFLYTLSNTPFSISGDREPGIEDGDI